MSERAAGPGPGSTAEGEEAAAPLTLQLLGVWNARVHGRPMPALRSRKGQWLLALLLFQGGRAVEREWLAGLLWPDSSIAQALYNLRRNLTDLRDALGPEAHRLQTPTTRTLCLDLTDAEVDVLRFDAAVAAGDRPSLERAVHLYRGPLLVQCVEEWITSERTAREQAYLGALETLAGEARAGGNREAQGRYLRRALAVDPLRESAQQALMEALEAQGDLSAALRVYREYHESLHRETNTAPGPEITALFEQLRARARSRERRLSPPSPPRRTAPEQTAAHERKHPAGNGERSPTGYPAPPGEAGHSPPAGGGRRLSSRLPHALSSFVGREREVREIAARLRAARLVTLTGPGGVGKTRLAVEVAHALADDHVNGVWFVDLTRLFDPALVPQAVASVLGVPEQPDRPLTETLAEFLRLRQLLLVLDNCEHLLAACAELAEALLSGSPALRVLATSRQSLGLSGEVVWPLSGLSVPPEKGIQVFGYSGIQGDKVKDGSVGVGPEHLNTRTPEYLTQFEAVRLFVERANAVAPHFALTERSAPSVRAICRRLDGIPLALELAAARVKALSVEEVAARLDDRLRLLTGGSRTAQPRHQTLRATFDWSYDLLPEPEQLLLQRLAVFAGSFSLKAVESVCAETRDEGWGMRDESGRTAPAPLIPHPPSLIPVNVLDLLTELVDKSLVVAEAAQETRYRLLETVREYAAAQMSAGEREAGARRHAAYYLALAEQAAPVLMGPEQHAAREPLEREHENLRSALAWAQTRGEAEMALRLGAALWRFWWLQGNLREGRDRLSAVLALSPAQTPPLALAKDARCARAQALQGAGRFSDALGEAAGMSLTRESLTVWQQVGDPRGIADVLNQLGDLELDRYDLPGAQARFEEALALYRQIEDRAGIARTLYNLATVTLRQENVDRTEALLAECQGLCRELSDRALSAAVLADQGWIALARGDVPRARRLIEAALGLRRDLGVRQPIAWSLLNVAYAARLQNDLAAAGAAAAESLAICREMDLQPGIGWALNELGDVMYAQGETEAAAALYAESLASAQQLGNPRGIAGLLISLGRVSLRRGDTAAAHTQLTEALALQRKLGNRLGEAWALEALAEAAAARGEPDHATELLGAAERVWERLPGRVPSLDPGSAEALLARLRSTLDDEAFTAHWESGRALGEPQYSGTGERQDVHDR